MNIPRKLELLKINVDSLVDHDDASEGEVQTAIDTLKGYIDSHWKLAKVRRAEIKAAKALPK